MEQIKTDKIIQDRINCIVPNLNERQVRIYLGAEARSIGWGGITKIHQLSGINRQTIASGMKDTGKEEGASELERGRIRHKGGGRKKEIDKSP